MVHSWLASRYPKRYARFIILDAPFILAMNAESPFVNLLTFESIAIYNWNVNEKKISKRKLLKNNFILWQASLLVNYWAGNLNKNIKVEQTNNQDGIKISYQFNF